MIGQVPWTPEVEARMQSPAAGQCLAWLKREVEAGVAKLWHCQDERDEAYMVTRLDRHPDELVVCYFEGSGMRKFGAEVVAAARTRGVPVRAHTTQRAVARLLRPLGFAGAEMVLRSA